MSKLRCGGQYTHSLVSLSKGQPIGTIQVPSLSKLANPAQVTLASVALAVHYPVHPAGVSPHFCVHSRVVGVSTADPPGDDAFKLAIADEGPTRVALHEVRKPDKGAQREWMNKVSFCPVLWMARLMLICSATRLAVALSWFLSLCLTEWNLSSLAHNLTLFM